MEFAQVHFRRRSWNTRAASLVNLLEGDSSVDVGVILLSQVLNRVGDIERGIQTTNRKRKMYETWAAGNTL